jgi:hypothetical protein
MFCTECGGGAQLADGACRRGRSRLDINHGPSTLFRLSSIRTACSLCKSRAGWAFMPAPARRPGTFVFLAAVQHTDPRADPYACCNNSVWAFTSPDGPASHGR